MSASAPHLVVVPVVLPLVTAALLLLLGDERRRLKSLLNIAATVAGLVVAATLLVRVDADGEIGVYLASNWEAPFGITLVADRLAALMLVLAGVVGLCAALYAEAAWARGGVYFHPLFQIQLMGLNGAFLTGDLFNLFVFFEVMLAASYGLHLHGSGWPRVRSGLHYIAVNLLASSLFLIGLAVLYGVMGTLNMADFAAKVASVPTQDRGLLYAGAAVLAVAFLVKAAMWPLNAWLVPAYTATSAPVAALFSIMTKVGIYALIRLTTLFVEADQGSSTHVGRTVLLAGGLATIAFGVAGFLASVRLDRIAGFAIIVSSGTLLAALGLDDAAVTAAALFYVLAATPAASALFLLLELIDRIGKEGRPVLLDVDTSDDDTNLDDEQVPLVGRAFPVSVALLSLGFMAAALIVAGLPPLSGFIAKLGLLSAVLGAHVSATDWVVAGLLLLSGFAATVSLARAGILYLWSTSDGSPPEVRAAEAGAVATLLAAGVLLTVFAEPVMRYTRDTADAIHAPRPYVESVRDTRARERAR